MKNKSVLLYKNENIQIQLQMYKQKAITFSNRSWHTYF